MITANHELIITKYPGFCINYAQHWLVSYHPPAFSEF